jgi:hypothetical protein
MARGTALENDVPGNVTRDQAREVTLKIGAIAISFGTDDTALRQMLEARYAGFIRSVPDTDFHFNVKIAAPSMPSSDHDVRVECEGCYWRAERGDFSASWHAQTGRGSIHQSPNPYSADTLLRIVHSIALAERGGFLLHAASAVRNGRAFLFPGISGAGKTTLARLAPPDVHILTDEISYVMKEMNGYRACGTPFAGELARIGENISAPIAGVFFLEKSNQNRLSEIEPAAALRALLRNILFLAKDEELVRRVFHTAAEFISAVPVHQMQFTPDARAWEMIA